MIIIPDRLEKGKISQIRAVKKWLNVQNSKSFEKCEFYYTAAIEKWENQREIPDWLKIRKITHALPVENWQSKHNSKPVVKWQNLWY